jgi:hypothetical protein
VPEIHSLKHHKIEEFGKNYHISSMKTRCHYNQGDFFFIEMAKILLSLPKQRVDFHESESRYLLDACDFKIKIVMVRYKAFKVLLYIFLWFDNTTNDLYFYYIYLSHPKK